MDRTLEEDDVYPTTTRELTSMTSDINGADDDVACHRLRRPRRSRKC